MNVTLPVKERGNRHRANWLPLVAGGVCAGLGLTVLVGWHTHNTVLLRIHPAFVAMAYNTALGFLLSGIGLCALALGRAIVATLAGGCVALLGLLTLSQYGLGWDLNIDQLLMRAYVRSGVTHPGRMAACAALCFSLSGVALGLSGRAALKPAVRSLATALLGSLVAGLGTIALSGYVTDVASMYAWGQLTRMAVHTASGFVVLGTGLVAWAWADALRGEPTAPPRWLPVPVGVIVATATICLWHLLIVEQHVQQARATRLEAINLRDNIEAQLQVRIDALVRIARRWEHYGQPRRSSWEFEAGLNVEQTAGYQAIQWIDPSFHVRWTVPLDPNRSALNLNLAAETQRRHALDAARQRRGVSVTRTVQLVQGGQGFLVYVPIFRQNRFEGFILGVFEVGTLLDAVVDEKNLHGYGFAAYDGDLPFYSRGASAQTQPHEIRETSVDLYGTAWRLQTWQRPELTSRMQSLLPQAALAAGFVLAALLAWAVHLAQTARGRAREVFAVNQTLHQQIAERKRAEEVLARQTEDLARSNTELEQFAYVASHDLQEPLRKIQTFGDRLRAKYADVLDEQGRDYLNRMHGAAARMQVLIQDLLALSRVATQGKPFVPVALDRIAREVLGDLEGRIERSGGRVDLRALPCLDGDPLQMRQLLQNLIGNGLKYHRPDEPPWSSSRPFRFRARTPGPTTTGHAFAGSAWPTTGSASTKSTRIASSFLSSVCTGATSTKGPGWDLPSAKRSWSATAARSRSKARPGRAPLSWSLCR